MRPRFPQCPPTANPKRKYCNTYTLKSGVYDLYKWSPPPNQVSSKNIFRPTDPTYCNARPYFAESEDWISTYCYNLFFIGSRIARSPYVVCDYVE